MGIKAKIAETQGKINEMKAKVNETAEMAKTAGRMKKEEIQADMAALDAAIDALDKAVDEQIESDIAEIDAVMDAVDAAIDDDIATAKGEINAAKENARLAKECGDSKLNAILLRAQMNVNAAKAKVKEKKAALEKADQEQRILDLLDYADKCQQLAVAMSMEADWAFLAAAAEATDYTEKYGEQ